MKTVCLIEGNIEERKGLLDKVKGSLSDYELTIFGEDDCYDQVSQSISELSCFGQRRLFILKALPRLRGAGISTEAKKKARDKIIRDFKKLFSVIPMGNLLVFDNVGISAKSFHKEVEKYGTVHLFKQNILKSDAKRDICEYFKKRKIDISESIALLVAESLNFAGNDVDIDKLSLLLLKLYNYAYGKSSITEKDISDICAHSNEYVMFSLYKIFDVNSKNTQYDKAFKMMKNYLDNSKDFKGELIRSLQTMLKRYSLILMVKSGIDLRISEQDIITKILNIIELKSSGNKQRKVMSPKDDSRKSMYTEKGIGAVVHGWYGNVMSGYTFIELLEIYCVVSKALNKIRFGCTDSEMVIILQIVFLTICRQLKVQTSGSDILEPCKMLRRVS